MEAHSDTTSTVGIIGLGYVGLPLATAFAEAGLTVIGYDLAEDKVAALMAGHSYIEDVPSTELAPLIASGALVPTTDPAHLAQCGAQLICVPTPLGEYREPDLSYVHSATETALAQPRSWRARGARVHDLARAPRVRCWHRCSRPRATPSARTSISPSAPSAWIPATRATASARRPRSSAASRPECSRRSEALYARICDTVHVVSTPESAEMSKIIENTFRAVNIALVNELAILADRMGVDIWEAIEASSTKPFGFMPFWPGPGLGGHCIPIDPFYLAWRARAFDMDSEFVELAGRVNVNMPYYAVSRIARSLNSRSKAVREAKVLILGMAYKANVGDLRESPSLKLLELLRAEGADVSYHDPHVATLSDEGLSSVELTSEQLARSDCVVIATAHEAIDLAAVVEHADLVVDLRNAVRHRLRGGATGAIPPNVDVL